MDNNDILRRSCLRANLDVISHGNEVKNLILVSTGKADQIVPDDWESASLTQEATVDLLLEAQFYKNEDKIKVRMCLPDNTRKALYGITHVPDWSELEVPSIGEEDEILAVSRDPQSESLQFTLHKPKAS